VIVHCLRLALSKGPNRVGVSLPSFEDGNIQFPKHCVFQYLEFWTMDRVQKPSNSSDYRFWFQYGLLLSKLAQVVEVLACVQEVCCLNLGQDSEFFLTVFLLSLGKCWDSE
jgi:hypothetical protein